MASEPFIYDSQGGDLSSAAGGYAPRVRYRHPMGLPPGSVRTIMTLMVVGIIWTLMLFPAEKQVRIPSYLVYLLFLMLGSSFFSRATQTPTGQRESAPLGLPRILVRLFIILGFAGVIGYGWYRDPEFFSKFQISQPAPEALVQAVYIPLVLIGAFFIGNFLASIAHMILEGPTGMPAWYQDIQAWLSVVAMLLLGAEVIIQLVINPTLPKESQLNLPHFHGVLAAVIAFYFGARA